MDLRGLTDEMLLRLLKADDDMAFKEIYSRYWKPVFEAAYHRLTNREIAKELVQTVFLRIWEKRQIIQITHLAACKQPSKTASSTTLNQRWCIKNTCST
jgi:hypothetical protein